MQGATYAIASVLLILGIIQVGKTTIYIIGKITQILRTSILVSTIITIAIIAILAVIIPILFGIIVWYYYKKLADEAISKRKKY